MFFLGRTKRRLKQRLLAVAVTAALGGAGAHSLLGDVPLTMDHLTDKAIQYGLSLVSDLTGFKLDRTGLQAAFDPGSASTDTAPGGACRQAGFLGGKEPSVPAKMSEQKYRILCNSQFATGYSGITKTGIWSAWTLEADEIRRTKGMKREDSFREDERLPSNERATLSDYRGSGFDRGHIFPNADSENRQAQFDSFRLSNMFPQVPEHNRGMWSELEQRTRKLALKHGKIHVVTGVAFKGRQLQRLGRSGPFVPSHVFKAVYLPDTGKASACVSENAKNAHCDWVSVAELETRTGINPFPALQGMAKNSRFKW